MVTMSQSEGLEVNNSCTNEGNQRNGITTSQSGECISGFNAKKLWVTEIQLFRLFQNEFNFHIIVGFEESLRLILLIYYIHAILLSIALIATAKAGIGLRGALKSRIHLFLSIFSNCNTISSVIFFMSGHTSWKFLIDASLTRLSKSRT